MNPAPLTEPFLDHTGLRNDIEKAILTHAGLATASKADSNTLLQLIDASSEAAELCEKLQRTAVYQARRADISWSEIGAIMGISRQAAQQRFAPEESPIPLPEGSRQIHGATAFNEMQILESEGKAGYNLVGFGPLFLTVMASKKVWEHHRVVSVNIARKRAQMEAAGWAYVGNWFPFHYFKRIVS